MREIERIQECSQYFSTLIRRRPDLVEWLVAGRNFYRRYALTELYSDLKTSVKDLESFGELLVSFREFKQRHFLRIGARDLRGMADLSETTAQLSDLACVGLQVGLEALWSRPDWWVGEAERETWRESVHDLSLVVMGLGKLGGNELNYVSDIDILYLHEEKTTDGLDSSSRTILLSRLCHWLSRLLADKVEGDRVFHVDLRLRPQGQDGVLVQRRSAAGEYYLQFGRAWERQALLKARPVAGDRSIGMAFLRDVRPFVFRRFLDFQAIDELREMRDRILAEAVRPGSGWQQFDVKLGIGGIREIEFLVQSLQLIYGGRNPGLDEPNTLRCIEKLQELKLLSSDVVREMGEAYVFLRRVEHWIQLDQNRQTQKLPQSEDARKRLALALGFRGDEKRFLQELDRHCTTVHGHFKDLFHYSTNECTKLRSQGMLPEDTPCEIDLPSNLPTEYADRLNAHLSVFPVGIQQGIADVLKEFASITDTGIVEKIVARLERYFGQVLKRPGLVKVFDSSSTWIKDFSRSLGQSELLSFLLSQNPSLVEGIASASGVCPDTSAWQSSSGRLIEATEDYEQAMEWIRRLRNERLLQLALADLRGELQYEALELDITAIADFVIRHTYERVLRSLSMDLELPLAILGLGKLGSREMGYLSDLDLVFVYQPRPGESEEQIPEDVVRLIQRFMRMLSTPLHEGAGYSVDARLRPTGNYGPLVVTRRSWLDYYSEQADLWELQALLRMRSVAGYGELCSWIEDKAREICYRKRNSEAVWRRLCHLRYRMEHERADERDDFIDIKLGMGGLADLEFLVQGYQLIDGHRVPELRVGSVRAALKHVVEELSGLGLPCGGAMAAFHDLRSIEHRMKIFTNHGSPRMSRVSFDALRTVGLWPPVHASSIENWEDLESLRRQVRRLLNHFCPELQ